MNTLFIGKVRLFYDSLDSTNSEAERLLKQQKCADGTVVITYEQIAGRGQMGNQWFNDSYKNLTLSIILHPNLAAQRAFLLNQVIALGVRKTIQHFTQKKVAIKCPNDILIEDKKVCGVLIQNTLSSKGISNSIVGIGINVNQEMFPENIGIPTSLFLETNKFIDLDEIEAILYKNIEIYYLKIKAQKWTDIQTEYLEYLYQKDEWHEYINSQGKSFSGCIKGVKSDGRLEVETSQGLQLFMFKEIARKL